MRVMNSWAAYQLDNAVAYAGIAIENALAERVNDGTDEAPAWRERYTLAQVLEPEFRLAVAEDAAAAMPVGVHGIVTDEVRG